METKNRDRYKTWGRSRSNRLANYDYSKDRPIHVTICTDNKENILIISPGESTLSLSKFLNFFKGKTTAVFKERKDLRKIWQRSAFDHVIRTEENLKAVIEYIMNNPVRKGIVEKADEYPYSKWFDVEIQRYL